MSLNLPILKIRITKEASNDLDYWVKSGEKKILEKINSLITDCLNNPTSGLGAPEQLRFQDFPTYSRRINRIHRLVYRVEDQVLIIISARYHYEK